MFRTYPLVLGAVVLLMTALMIGCPFVAHYELASDGSGDGGTDAAPSKPCMTVAECDDTNPCTTDACEAKTCKYTADNAAKPDSGTVPSCKVEVCVNGAVTLAPAEPGTPCANGTTYCNAVGVCVPCTANADCSAGLTCFKEKECVSCTDLSRNGDEADVDCGGSCGKCNDGMKCAQNKDCVGNRCEAGFCISCKDGIKNGDETDIDCGGSACLACLGNPCNSDLGCAKLHCVNSICCSTDCSGTCKGCNAPSLLGTCADLPLGYEHSGCNSASEVCQTGMCVPDTGKLHFGAACSANSDCFSNQCPGTTCK